VLGGLLGAFFIYVNYSINKLRKHHLNTKWKKVFEAIILVAITATVIYFAPLILKNDCLEEEDKQIEADFIQYKCGDN
jgi:H+/Cl- antiporter ClcA